MPQIISKRYILPSHGVIQVEAGDKVLPDTSLAIRNYIPGAMHRIEASDILGINAGHLGEQMRFKIDERVSIGDTLAESVTFHSLKEVISPIDGYVAFWSNNSGCIYLRCVSQAASGSEPIVYRASEMDMQPQTFISSFLPAQVSLKSKETNVSDGTSIGIGAAVDLHSLGKQIIVMAGQKLFSGNEMVAPYTCQVTAISETNGIIEMSPLFTVDTIPAGLTGIVRSFPEPNVCSVVSFGYSFKGTVGYGTKGYGLLCCIDTQNRDLHIADIQNVSQGSLVAARGGSDLETLQTLATMKIAGLVLGRLDIDILHEFCGHNPLQHLGQLMTMPFPVMLVQGFEGCIDEETYQDLASLQGRCAYLDATTRLTAGANRPELLIPLAEEVAKMHNSLLTEDITPEGDEMLAVGDRILLLREPYFGYQAELRKIGTKREKTSANTFALLAEVTLIPGGEQLTVPLANCQKLHHPGGA